MENGEKNTVEEVLNIFKKGWNKQVILYGPPGTSKTYSATEIAARFLASYDPDKDEESLKGKHDECEKYLEEKIDQYKVIQFHPSYSYEDFVRGIVVKTKGENGQTLSTPTYEVERKIIEEFGDGANEDKPRVLIIDEINRAPLGSVLGELIYGLEYRGKPVSTPYVYKKGEDEIPLKVSEHLYIIGTMNTADRSIGTMDYAVRRRFAFLPVLPDIGVIKKTWDNTAVGGKAETLFKAFMEGIEGIKEKIKEIEGIEEKIKDIKDKKGENGIFAEDLLEDSELDVNDIKIGHTYFLGKKEASKKEVSEEVSVEDEKAYLKYRIDYQIRPVYHEYIKDGLIKRDGLDVFDDFVEIVKKIKE